MQRFLKNNSLSLAAFGLFLLSLLGQALSGAHVYNDNALEHGRAAVGFASYLGTGEFTEALFENWESEFFQMAVFVVITKFLVQKGSSESKKPEELGHAEKPTKSASPDAPWPVRRGGFWLSLYERSLSLTLAALFVGSFLLHAYFGAENFSEDQLRHGGHAVSMLQYLGTSQFWFESFQNWQSEFLSVGALVLLSIFLRERGSPQSKPVAAPHSETE